MAPRPDRISWLRVPSQRATPASTRALWQKPLERLGFIPNVFRAYALRPRHLELWNAFFDELMRGESRLTKIEREMIGLVVSSANRCHYCVVSHAAALRHMTGDPQLVEQLRTGFAYARLTTRQRAMLEYAVKLTEDPERCSEKDVSALRRVGFGDEDILDISEVAAMFNFTNRLASGLGWRPNREYAEVGFEPA